MSKDKDENLEEVFNAINEKLKQASVLIRDAGKIADMNGTDLPTLMYDGKIDYELFPALDAVGWNTSSMSC